jgi:hypothetical protein
MPVLKYLNGCRQISFFIGSVCAIVPEAWSYTRLRQSPERTIAKRRSYAVLVDHMQAVMTDSDLYGELKGS